MLVALIGCRVSCVTSVGKGQAIACVGTSRRAIFLGIQRTPSARECSDLSSGFPSQSRTSRLMATLTGLL